jgi:Cu2+-exporting ATPase
MMASEAKQPGRPENEDEVPLVDPSRYVRSDTKGVDTLTLTISNVHCASCIARIEQALTSEPGVLSARVNLSTRRLTLAWKDGVVDPRHLMAVVSDLGYPVAPFDPESGHTQIDREDSELLRCLAVAGFAAGNIMLLSVSIWAGAVSDMGSATRDLFHWLSALIGLPAVAYAGRPFFRSAVKGLASGTLSMDVPISVGVVLATAMSLFETISGGEHAYFDASVSLLFFLLVGRYLDRRARSRARSSAENLLALSAGSATLVGPDGTRRVVPAADLTVGATVLVAAGQRIPADGVIVRGSIQIDTSLVTGESLPGFAMEGEKVFAGTLDLSGPGEIRVTACGPDTLLSEIVRLMEAAEQGRARYVRLADRVSRLYAPVVHVLALATFVGWIGLSEMPWQQALLVAVSVLIITCPCALGLAVPAVQVVASGLLMRRGILLKSPDALERLADVDTVAFDKTGTLTVGRPELEMLRPIDRESFLLAAALASGSRHPLAKALIRAAGPGPFGAVERLTEFPGRGLEGLVNGERVKLGSRDWCGGLAASDGIVGPELWLAREGRSPQRFVFRDKLRSDAPSVVETLKDGGYEVRLLSGDLPAVAHGVAATLGIDFCQAGLKPEEKVAALETMRSEGRKVLMVGDGLNDAPALASAHVSMSPSSAADISQTTADLVFQGDALKPVALALRVARASASVIRQNITLAILYNVLAVPIAVVGYATPLVAAIAMSVSSILVTLNAIGLRWRVRL